ncbi:hypothetical protein C8J57DRAFT_170241 [Mycena rebaudengoi]|nr:hypothetical protein C8J57DRAFT_170241 [Mycena rebaudengoi]
MSVINRIREAAIVVVVYALVGLCLPCFLCWDAVETRRATLPDPRPLPIKRIDIHQNQITAQSPRCHLLRLPAELRELIFEMALGRRIVQILLVPQLRRRRRVIRTKCYRSAEQLNTAADDLGAPRQTDMLPVALLRACRQVYVEALPILHQRNTFYFNAKDFRPAILGALGEYSFGNIRSVHLTRCSFRIWLGRSVFSLLPRMGLRSLTIEFQEDEWMAMLYADTPQADCSLDSQWCQDLLSLPKLQRFDVIFKDSFGAEDPTDREAFKQQLRELMTGPLAAET